VDYCAVLINDLSRDAVLWCRQEGGEDRSSVGCQQEQLL